MSDQAIKAMGRAVTSGASPMASVDEASASDSVVRSKSGPMTTEELMALPVSFPLVTAGRAFDIGRTKAHELARAGEFPCRVLRIGNSYRVTKADLLRALGFEDQPLMAQAG